MRIAQVGWEWGTAGGYEGLSGNGYRFVKGRTQRENYAKFSADPASDLRLDPQVFTDSGNAQPILYSRFYIKLLQNATNGLETRCWGIAGNSEGGDDSLVIQITTSGALKLYNWGNGGLSNAQETLGTTSVLNLNQWYRVEVYALYHVGAGHGTTELRLYDASTVTIDLTNTLVSSIGPLSPVTSFGLNVSTKTNIQHLGINNIGAFAGNCWYAADDWSEDKDTWCGPGEIIILPITGIGFYPGTNGWLSNVGDVNVAPIWQNVASVPLDNLFAAAPNRIDANTTPSGQISFTIRSWADAGITGTIKGIAVNVFGQNGAANAQVFVRKTTIGNVVTEVYSQSYVISGCRHFWDATELGGILLTDTIEIGIKKDATSGTFLTSGITAFVEVQNQVDPVPVPPPDQVIIKRGTYVGTGLPQTISGLGFSPDWLTLHITNDGEQARPIVFWKGPTGGTFGPVYAAASFGFGMMGRYVPRMTTDGFIVAGNAIFSNAPGKTYSYLAMSDPFARVTDRGSFCVGINKEWTQALANSFNPTVLWVNQDVPNGTVAFTGRWNTQSANTASHLDIDNADGAGLIEAMGVGSFQVGNNLNTSDGATWSWVAWRDGHWDSRTLIRLGAYTGDGTTFRPITVALANAIDWVLVVPSNGEPRTFKSATHSANASQEWISGFVRPFASGSLITSMNASTFTVRGGGTGNLNVTGVKYQYLAFAQGIDEPLLTAGTLTPTGADTNRITKPFSGALSQSSNVVMFRTRVPDGVEGDLYEGAVSATSSPVASPWVYDIVGGELPDGVTLDANTGALLGIPTQRGEFSFVIRATHRDT